MCNIRIYNSTFVAWLLYYSILAASVAHIASGIYFLIKDSTICTSYSFVICCYITLILTTLSPVIGTLYVIHFQDKHYNSTVFTKKPSALSSITYADQIINVHRYFEGVEDSIGQAMLFQALAISMSIQLIIVIYSFIILFGGAICTNMKSTGLYIWLLVTFATLLFVIIIFCICLVSFKQPNASNDHRYRAVDNSIDEMVSNDETNEVTLSPISNSAYQFQDTRMYL